MNELQASERQIFCRSWSQMVTSLSAFPWKLWADQYQIGLKLMEDIYRQPASAEVSFKRGNEAASQTVDEFRGLERQAAERVRQGFAPPKEIYELPYRDRIDWSKFPDWARPTDPELFQGCAHEG